MRGRCIAIAWSLCAACAFGAPLRTVKVVNDRAPDCSSLDALVASVTRECTSDDEKAIAIFNVCRYLYYHHAYPSEPDGIGALKMVNVYGWSLCGGQHSVLAALWDKAGFKWRYRGWSNPGHTTVECFYGGKWHYLDTFLDFYAWMPDPSAPGGRTIAGQLDIKANPALVTDGFIMDEERKVCYHADDRFELIRGKANWTAPAFMVCGDDLPGVLSGVASSNDAGSPRGWASIQFDDKDYSTSVDLDAGYALTLAWDVIDDAYYFRDMQRGPNHTCGDKDYRNCPSIGPLLEPYADKSPRRTWSNGTLRFKADLGSDAVLASFAQSDNVAWQKGALAPKDAARPAWFVVAMRSPYVVAKATGSLACAAAKVEASRDGTAWKGIALADLTKEVSGSYRYLVRVTFTQPLTAFELESTVQHNQEALPYLAPGKNTITISGANPEALGKNRLVVTYAYRTGARNATAEQLCERGAEISRRHSATWAETPTVVRKEITTFPCTFEIVVPTRKDAQPVYPRMLFLRREVLAPGQEPLPAPAAATTPAVGPNETLATLPNPWLVGARPPATRVVLPTKAVTTPLGRVSHVTKQGEVFAHQFVKWLKDGSNAWIMLIGVDGVAVPAARDLASAKLVFEVIESHDKADMQAAAVILTAPFEVGKPYDFENLGATAGTTIVKKGDGPDKRFDTPRRYEIDVTKAVRAWANGAPACGLALRIVPNRGVDDGWTVRFTPNDKKPPELVIATYVEK